MLENLTVQFDDGVVTLAGDCDTTKTRDKAILMAGNVEDVKDVKSEGLRVPQEGAPAAPAPAAGPEPTPAPASNPLAAAGSVGQAASRAAAPPSAVPATQPSAPQAQPAAAEQTYTIQSGDSLSKIAKQFYGDANKYMVIFNANKDVLKNPDTIFPGQEIKIPAL